MKHFMLTVAGALSITACGAADKTTLAEEENTASASQALMNEWTALISEEAPNFTSCGTTAGVGATKARCTGPYCDNMALYCGTVPPGWGVPGTGLFWTSAVSEEQPEGVMCPDNGLVARIVDGISATGPYGDNVSVRCRSASIPTSSQLNCGWTPYFSEEQDTQVFRYNIWSLQTAVARGVRCSGSYCDNMSYYVCENKCTSHDQCFGACVNGVCTVG